MKKTTKRVLIAGAIIFLLLVSSIPAYFLWREIRISIRDNKFKQFQLGMTKNDVMEFIGQPDLGLYIDTSLIVDFEVWSYQEHFASSDWPRCYFINGDSILVKVYYEGVIDLSLSDDSLKTLDSLMKIKQE